MREQIVFRFVKRPLLFYVSFERCTLHWMWLLRLTGIDSLSLQLLVQRQDSVLFKYKSDLV